MFIKTPYDVPYGFTALSLQPRDRPTQRLRDLFEEMKRK